MEKIGDRSRLSQSHIPIFNPQNKKKPPEKQHPRGAKDTKLFRERLDASDSTPMQKILTAVLNVYSKRSAGFLANRSAPWSAEDALKRRPPMQTQPRGFPMIFFESDT